MSKYCGNKTLNLEPCKNINVLGVSCYVSGGVQTVIIAAVISTLHIEIAKGLLSRLTLREHRGYCPAQTHIERVEGLLSTSNSY